MIQKITFTAYPVMKKGIDLIEMAAKQPKALPAPYNPHNYVGASLNQDTFQTIATKSVDYTVDRLFGHKTIKSINEGKNAAEKAMANNPLSNNPFADVYKNGSGYVPANTFTPGY